MSKDQLAAILIVLGMLAAAIQQFYALKTEVYELRLKLDYVTGSGWKPPVPLPHTP